jgi:hypothetical protein
MTIVVINLKLLFFPFQILLFFIAAWYDIVHAAKSDVIDKPYFGGDNARNVTALVNESVTLKCTVKNKGNRTVRRHYVVKAIDTIY